ncbi:MAG TPA: hypothetical protein PKA00_04545 [Saprospiraceae bacterium]|nr:hypothetical protein [Saprospiraceae bacterium]HMQ82149.1 hypothetical protein [Saprospiraceae bacterium]
MSSNTQLIHPLIHDGVSQTERLLAALIPANLQLDERSMQDLIVAAYRYACLLKYYNEENQPDGDWRCFWEVEALTFLAVLAELDTEVILQQFNELEIGFAQDIDEGAGGPFDPGGEDITNFYDQAQFIYQIALQVQKAYRDLPDDLAIKREIAAMIDKRTVFDGENLVDALHQLIAIHKEVYSDEHGQALPYHFYEPFFGSLWNLPDSDAFDAIKFQASYTREDTRALFRRFYEVLVKIRMRAQYWFDRLINEPNLHQPHVALFLSFLRLFRHAQDSLNSLTGKHLDYYYEKILCLDRRPAVPDDVFLVFELAKGFEETLVEKGTAFLAGKDANGRPLLFEALENWVVRDAQVKEIKNTHFDLCNFQTTGKILANPDVNTAYANGEILPNEKPASWRALGDDGNLPAGEIGFAIASPQLILREGKRILDVYINLVNTQIPTISSDDFIIQLSSPEEWITPVINENITFTSDDRNLSQDEGSFKVIQENGALHIRVVLEKDDLPVDTLGEDLAIEAGFNTGWPVMKVTLARASQIARFYDDMRGIEFEEIKIAVDVTGIRENLIIQSDQGVFDGTQKIYPFGPVPAKGHRFYIGSTEVFQKALNSLKVNFDWIAPPDDFDDYYRTYNLGFTPYTLPNPKVKIDFIDRADNQNVNIEQIARIAHDGDRTVRIRISDVNFNSVADVIFELKTSDGILTPLTPTILEEGAYEFTLPDVDLANAEIIASKPGADFEPLAFAVLENGAITTAYELVLFPLEKAYQPATNIRGLVKGLNDGAFLNAITVNGSSQTLTNGAYATPLASTLNFEQSGYQANNIFDLEGFSVVDVYMEPIDYAPEQVFRFPPNAEVDIIMEIKDADGSSLDDVTWQIISGIAQTVGDGQTLFEVDGEAKIKLSKPGYKDVWFPLEYATRGNAVLLPGASVEIGSRGTAAADTAEIILQKWDGTLLANRTFSIRIGNGSPSSMDTNADGKLILSAFTSTADVEIIHPHFLAFTVGNLDPATSATVQLATETFSSKTGATPSSVDVTVIDLLGLPVEGASVEASNGTSTIIDTTDTDGKVTLDGLSGSGWRIKVSKGDNTVISPDTTNVREKEIYINIGVLEKSRPFAGILIGRLTNTAGDPIEDALVTAGSQTQRTNTRGEYTMTGLAEAEIQASGGVHFYHPSYQIFPGADVVDNSIIDIMLLPHLQNFVYEGKITDIFNIPLSGVEIGIKDIEADTAYTLTKSDSDGLYRVAVSPALTDEVEVFFVIPGYDTVILDFPTPDVPTGTSTSLLHVRMRPSVDNFSPLLDAGEMEARFDIRINALNLVRDVRTQHFVRYEPTLKRGFVRFTLVEDDFKHAAYPQLLTWYTLDAAGEPIFQPTDTTNIDLPPPLPNPPYTPATNGISLEYTSEQIITGVENEGIDQYFHLLPFNGHKEVSLLAAVDIRLVCPYYAHSKSDAYADGNLYLGIEKLKPGTNLSLLFQIEEGSERKAEWQPPKLHWSYLTKNNTWTAFESTDVLLDTTFGLTRSGLVQLKIPKTAIAENTMLNPALYWIRIAAVENREADIPVSVRALPNLVSVRAQAILAQFADKGNDPAHLSAPLPAGTISKLQISRTSVKKVEQPFDSFGGRLPEQGNDFYLRISERLRHRDRAIQVWDYERLLLEQYSKVHRVKCLPHTRMIASTDNCSTNILQDPSAIPPDLDVQSPGYVLLAVIPDLTQRTATAQAEPRFSFGDLLEMEDYLRTKTNLFVAWERESPPWLCEPDYPEDETKYLWVVNPKYEPIRLSFKVAFLTGFDETFFKFQLDEELKNYLAPWLENPAAPITFGRTLYQSALIAFIESREYVDAIADFRLYKAPAAYLLDEVSEECLVKNDRVIPATPRSVLTTYIKADKLPDETDHLIETANKTDWCVEAQPRPTPETNPNTRSKRPRS